MATIWQQIERSAKRSRLEAVDITDLLKRELGQRAANTLKINDYGRWEFRHGGKAYSASTVSQVAAIVAELRRGGRRVDPVQEGFSLPMARGGER